MEITYRRIDEIQHLPVNAKEHDIGAIIASLRRYGFADPIGISATTGHDLDGNGRLDALRAMLLQALPPPAGIKVDADGMWAVPVVVLDVAEGDEAGLALALNRTNELGGYNQATLATLLSDLAAARKLEGTGYDADDVDAVLKAAGRAAEKPEDPGAQTDKAEELRAKWGVEPGQLWQLGDHRLICGDCTDRAIVERVMGGEKATLVFTDPPYGVSIGAKQRLLNSFQKAGRNLADIENDDLDTEDLKSMLLNAFILAKCFLADDCSVFVCAPQGGSLGLMMMMMMKDAGLEIRHVLNWVKNSPTFSLGRLDYEYQHEPILFTWVKTHKRNKSGEFHTSVWNVDKPRHSAEHPTMKPVELPVNAIMNHTDHGDIVYEPFCGSGTDIIACEQTGRRCRAVEISPAYVAVAIERWANMTGKKPELAA